MLSPKIAFVITILFLALSACGSLNSAKVEPKSKTSAVNATGSTTQQRSELTTACMSQGGRMSSDGSVCLTRIIKNLAPGEVNPSIEIDPSFLHGKFIVATGSTSANAVDILYDGRPFARIPARMQGDLGKLPTGRPLTFFINSNNYRDVSVIIWTCYSGSITNRVICPPTQIPND